MSAREVETAKAVFEKIKKYVAKLDKLYPLPKGALKFDGKLYYSNGNDGTEFDWQANYHTCEIGQVYANDYFFIKMWVEEKGCISGFLYYPDYSSEPVELDEIYIGKSAALDFAAYVQANFDDKDIYDVVIEDYAKFNPNDKLNYGALESYEEEEEDDWYGDDRYYGRRTTPRHVSKRSPVLRKNTKINGRPVRRVTKSTRKVTRRKPASKNGIRLNVRKMF